MPEFQHCNLEQLRLYRDALQALLFAYDKKSPEYVVLKKAWKDIADAHTDRIANEAIKTLNRQERQASHQDLAQKLEKDTVKPFKVGLKRSPLTKMKENVK